MWIKEGLHYSNTEIKSQFKPVVSKVEVKDKL